MPKEILELEGVFNKLSELEITLFTSRKICTKTIVTIEEDKLNMENIKEEDLIAIFVGSLLESINWYYLNDEEPELAKAILLKLANVVVEYGNYMSISNPIYKRYYSGFWAVYIEHYDTETPLLFLKKINEEIKNIVESSDEEAKNILLQKTKQILDFFNTTTICFIDCDRKEEAIEELDKAVVTLLNLCIEYEYKLDCLSELGTPLTSIFENLNSKETKNLIMKYLIGYTDYFQGLRMDNRECVINTEYSEYSGVEKSEVFRMYLENALLLKRKDLYSGEIFDKVLNKLFRRVRAERNGEVGFWGEDSLEDFSNALLVIEEICNNPDNFKLLIDSDFFDKIYKMFNFFMLEHYKSNKHLDLQNADLYDIETKMKIRFFKLSLTVRKQQSGQKIQGEFHLKR